MEKYIISVKGKVFLMVDDTLTPIDPEKVYEVKEKRTDARTVAQNSAMHKYFSFVAEALNSAGYSVPYVLNKRHHVLIKKVFEWGRPLIPQQFHATLEKMESRLLRVGEDELEWNTMLVKELIWKKIQKIVLGKESTALLAKSEIDMIFNEVSKLLAQKFGISIPFPSVEQMIHDQNYANS